MCQISHTQCFCLLVKRMRAIQPNICFFFFLLECIAENYVLIYFENSRTCHCWLHGATWALLSCTTLHPHLPALLKWEVFFIMVDIYAGFLSGWSGHLAAVSMALNLLSGWGFSKRQGKRPNTTGCPDGGEGSADGREHNRWGLLYFPHSFFYIWRWKLLMREGLVVGTRELFPASKKGIYS